MQDPKMILFWLFGFLSCSHALERLSQDTYPVKYHLVITPDMSDLTYKGNLVIQMVMKNSSNFALDCDGLNVTSSSMIFDGAVPVVHNLNQTEDRLHVHTAMTMRDTYDITFNLTFTGHIRTDLVGFYLSKYMYNGTQRHLGSTHFEASGARKAFPCFDEPSFRADFTLEVILEPGWMALSNTPVVSNEASGGVRKIRFAEKKSIPVYLVAWVVYEEQSFDSTSGTIGNVTYSVWSNKAYGDERMVALSTSPVAVNLMEKFTGIHSQAVTDKVDLVAIPDFSAGAMENWGLITFRESMLLADTNYSTASDLQLIMMVVAHELAHQWFGNLVTPQWWSYTWLSEGFARYLQYFLLDEEFSELRLPEQFVVDRRQLALDEDSPHSHPLTNENLTSQSDIMDMFDVITYDKGASVIHMISTLLGPSFKTGINTYLTNVQKAGGVTNPDHFFSSFPSLPKGMRQWTESPGYPVVIASENNNILSLRQIQITGWNTVNESHWLIPISVNVNGNVTWNHLQPNGTLQIPLSKNSSLFINVNQTGYFRVLYREPGRWLPPNASSLDRSQLLDDSLSLAYAGLVPYEQAILAANYHLSADLDYLPWRTGLRHLTRIRDLLEGSDLQAQFTDKILSMMSNVINYVAFNDTGNMSVPMKQHQVNVLKHACEFGHPDCLNAAQQVVYNISGSCIEKRSALLCTGVRRGNQSAWDTVMMRYNQSKSPAEKQLMLNSLACTVNTTLINKLLDLLWTDEVRRHDVLSTISLISSTRTGAQETLQYLINNIIKIHDYFGETRSVMKIFSSATKYVNESTYVELKEMALALNLNTLMPELKLDSFMRSLERKMNWKKMAVLQLKAFLTGEPNPTMSAITDKPTVAPTQEPADASSSSITNISFIWVILAVSMSFLRNYS